MQRILFCRAIVIKAEGLRLRAGLATFQELYML